MAGSSVRGRGCGVAESDCRESKIVCGVRRNLTSMSVCPGLFSSRDGIRYKVEVQKGFVGAEAFGEEFVD